MRKRIYIYIYIEWWWSSAEYFGVQSFADWAPHFWAVVHFKPWWFRIKTWDAFFGRETWGRGALGALGSSMGNWLFTMGQLGSHVLRHQNFGVLVMVQGVQGVAPSCWDAVLEAVKSFLWAEMSLVLHCFRVQKIKLDAMEWYGSSHFWNLEAD